MRDLFALALQQVGMQACPAGTATQAEKVMSKGDLDFMIVDLNLGGGHTGVSLALDWHKRGCLLPFMVVTGTPEHSSLASLNGLPGFQGVLSKPFPIDELLIRLRKMASE
mgnify:CR=1 FL=1|jgi:DNA-binding response OmpR family regulator